MKRWQSAIVRCALAVLILVTTACRTGQHIVDVTRDLGRSYVEKEVFDLVNDHRTALGLTELRLYEPASEEARKHSEDLAAGEVGFGHVGFESRVARLRTKIRILSAGENEGYVSGKEHPAEAMVRAWLGSRGHRANIEGDYNLTGVGVAKDSEGAFYFTQIFLKTTGD